jgi:tetratricopeptide (TPR) repeat protein
MVKKGNDREAMYGKNTVFSWQGQVWTRDQAESTASRTRKFVRKLNLPNHGIIIANELGVVESPPGMSVKTPKSPNEIYNEIHSPAGRAELRQSRQNSTELLSKTFTLPLSWNGNTRENLSQLHDMARESFYRGDFDNAETGYMNALEGHRYLLAPTHEDTVKVAYELANFYAEQRRMTDADNVIEELSQEFVERWGIKHRRTTQHVIKVVELLNSWNRETDALAFLARAHDVAGRAERDFEDTGRAQNNTRRIRKPKSRIPTHREQLESIREDIVAHPNVSMVDYGINIARRYAATDEPAVEAFLKVTEDICNQNGPDLAVQGLRARAERLTWYQKRNTITQNENAFTSTKAFFQTLWNGWPWDREKIRSLDMLEASMEVASALLKASFSADATTIFRDVERKAAHVFGPDDERTIWTLITIGIVHQNARNWREAKPWFEQALAAALQAYDDDDGITKSLETAMEKEHFSYISEEGRPFKTIFGVSGITIRPNRLHLE